MTEGARAPDSRLHPPAPYRLGVAQVAEPAPPAVRSRSTADDRMRRALRVSPDASPAGHRRAQRAFSTSIAVSTVRCLLTYVVLPFVAPAVGLAAGVGPVLGITVGSVAIVANVMSVRRFWAADHRLRWLFTAVAGAVILMLAVMVGLDLAHLLG